MKVLVIDDEPLVRRSLGRALKTQAHEVLEAVDGASGLKMWRESNPDLVFLDVLMPGLSGPQVLQELDPQLKARTKIVLISAFSGEHSPETAQRLGADCFIPKPFEDIFAVVKLVEDLKKHGS
jgi:DNA-binding response OmpR family regulator